MVLQIQKRWFFEGPIAPIVIEGKALRSNVVMIKDLVDSFTELIKDHSQKAGNGTELKAQYEITASKEFSGTQPVECGDLQHA